MKTLLVLNDHTATASHAAIFALEMAQKIRANIVIATISPSEGVVHHQDFELSETGAFILQRSALMKTLFAQKNRFMDFRPVIQEIELVDFTGDEIFPLTVDRNIYMVIRGIEEFQPSALTDIKNAITMMLGKVKCPLLLVPSSWDFNEFRDLVYFTDLRFCGIDTVNYIADFASEWKAKVAIAHSTASGLPSITTEEANDIFKNEVLNHISYKNVSMNRLNEAKVPDAIKMLVHDFRADLLVFVNQHFHFDTFTNQYFKDQCALYQPVPMLIFPY